MAGKFYPIEVKGTYLRTYQDPQARAATTLSLSSLGVVPGDYLSLRGSGAYIPGTTYPPGQSMIGCFFNAQTRISPANYGQQMEVITGPTAMGSKKTDVTQDFNVPFDKKIIVRVPDGATAIKLCPNDSFYGDNRSQNYGVIIARPNKSRPARNAESDKARKYMSENSTPTLAEDDTGIRDALSELEVPLTPLPTATRFLKSPFSSNDRDETRPQWRGWYNIGWKPGNSGYNPPSSPYREHYGWDIFAPRGTKLVAPIGPAYLSFHAPVQGYGKMAAMSFSYRKNDYSLIFGHIENIIGTNRLVRAGEEVAFAGCEGNAMDESCGIEFSSGGYSDHVHIGVYYKGNPVHPATFLRWSIKTPV